MSTTTHKARVLYRALAAATLALAATQAQANVWDDALQCAKDAGTVAVLPFTEGYKVANYAASQPQCIVQIAAADPLTLAGAGTMVALNAANVIPASYGGCQSAVYGPAMKPLAGALAGGLAAVGVPQNIVGPLQGIASGELLQALNQIPALYVITAPIDCGCGMLDAGVSVDNIIGMGKTIASAGESCVALLGNVAGAAVKAIKDPGKTINKGIESGLVAVIGRQGYSDLSGGWDSIVLGQSQSIPLPQLYQAAFAPKVERYAREMQKNWGYFDNVESDIVRHCVNYLDGHRWSEENAREKCFNGMLMGQSASTEKRFINAGFLQQVSARYAQLRLPSDLDRRRGLAGLNAVNGNAAAAPLAQNRLHGAMGFDINGAPVLDAQGYPTYGLGSVGALASARLREYTAQAGEGLPVMNQRIDEAITFAMNNSPALQQWRAAMAAIPQVPCTLQADGFVCSDYDKINACFANYVERMRLVPEAVRVGERRGKRIPTPMCRVANTLQAEQIAKLNMRMSLKADGIACNLGGPENAQLVCIGGNASGMITTNDPAFVCNQRLRKLYGKFGLPRPGRDCVAAALAPPTYTAPTAGAMPPSVQPAVQPQVQPAVQPQVPPGQSQTNKPPRFDNRTPPPRRF